MKVKYKGPDYTYRRMVLKNVFGDLNLKEELYQLAKSFEIKKVTKLSDTLLGSSAILSIMLSYPYYITVGLYRDGWYIRLESKKEMHNHITVNDRKVIFDDMNTSSGWTTENRYVPEIMLAIAKKVREEWKNLTK